MARHLIAILAGLAAIVVAAQGLAQEPAAPGSATLSDPTRPPASMGQGQGGPVISHLPVLQSVFISRDRKWAIIGGQRVDLGAKFGESRLTGLSEGEAVLEGPQGRTVLRLVPEVQSKLTGAVQGIAEEPRVRTNAMRPDR
jgi:MSHA biogenesis protein MshK